MQPNQYVEVTIEDVGINGEGIGHLEDKTVFVPYALPEEVVRVQIVHIKRNLVYARLDTVIKPSQYRVKPECNRYAKCGGCDMLHVVYEKQLEYKKKTLQETMRKAGCLVEVQDVVPSQPYLPYRNKIQLPFGIVNGKVAMGFFRENSHKIVSITKCFLHDEWATKLIRLTLAYANENNVSVYEEDSGKGLLRHLVARNIGGTLTVTLVINGESLPNIDSYYNSLKTEFEVVALYLSVNKKRTNVILGDKLIPICAPEISVNVMGVDIGVNPMSFFQVNDYVRDLIYKKVIELVAPDKESVVIDAYSGVGLLGAIMAKSGAQIYNIEIIPEAIEDANKLYEANGIKDRATNVCGDSAVVLPEIIDKLNLDNKRLSIVLDPPRKGISQEVVNTLISLAEHHEFSLVYVSCNPATLGRDIKLLSSAFTPTEIIPFDMFPATKHVESVVCFTRRLDNELPMA